MDAVKVIINKKNFVLAFGMKFLRVLGEKFGTKTMGLTQQKVLEFLKTFDEKMKDISFEQIDTINMLIISAVASSEENNELPTLNELDDMFLKDTSKYLDIVKIIMVEFVNSLPRNTDPESLGNAGKQKAPKKQAIKKT